MTGVLGVVGTHQATIAPAYHAFGKVLTAEVNDAIRLLFSSGNIASGHVVVYGYPAP